LTSTTVRDTRDESAIKNILEDLWAQERLLTDKQLAPAEELARKLVGMIDDCGAGKLARECAAGMLSAFSNQTSAYDLLQWNWQLQNILQPEPVNDGRSIIVYPVSSGEKKDNHAVSAEELAPGQPYAEAVECDEAVCDEYQALLDQLEKQGSKENAQN